MLPAAIEDQLAGQVQIEAAEPDAARGNDFAVRQDMHEVEDVDGVVFIGEVLEAAFSSGCMGRTSRASRKCCGRRFSILLAERAGTSLGPTMKRLLEGR